MEGNKKGLFYFHMVMGTGGLLLIMLMILRVFEEVDGFVYVGLLIGFAFTASYMHFLEAAAGISRKFIWIKSLLTIVIMLALFLAFW